jgi:SAM-dependent methyltransferase
MGKKYAIVPDPVYGYLRVDPLPSQEDVERYYQEEFYSSTQRQFNDSSLAAQEEEREFFNSRWEAIYRVCEEYFGTVQGRSLFDVGFGFAQAMLYFSKKGIHVSGLEPSPEGVDYARSKDLEVFQAGIEDFTCVGEKRFDVVTFLNVLEHLRRPADTLMSIRQHLLKPSGLLVIDVPNEFNDFQTVANAEFGLKEWWVCPPNHINYFSVRSLKALLSACGYTVYRCESSFPLEIFMLSGDVYVGNPDLGKICHQRRVRFEHLMRKHGKGEKLRQLYQILTELDLGRQCVAYATPR